jgi:hypothetical protein
MQRRENHVEDCGRQKGKQVQSPCGRSGPGCLRINKVASEGVRSTSGSKKGTIWETIALICARREDDLDKKGNNGCREKGPESTFILKVDKGELEQMWAIKERGAKEDSKVLGLSYLKADIAVTQMSLVMQFKLEKEAMTHVI